MSSWARAVFGVTALMADEAVTQSQQSVHLKARVIVRGEAVDVLFERVVGMEMFGATGGASPLPYEKREG